MFLVCFPSTIFRFIITVIIYSFDCQSFFVIINITIIYCPFIKRHKIIQPFITDITEYADNPNKKVTSDEVQRFYEEALAKSYSYCNRLNVEDLTSIEEGLFIKGVCLLTASDLWNKYNIRVNNEDMEDTYTQSFGGLLYKQAMMILNSFINQRVTNLSSLKQKANSRKDCWFI